MLPVIIIAVGRGSGSIRSGPHSSSPRVAVKVVLVLVLAVVLFLLDCCRCSGTAGSSGISGRWGPWGWFEFEWHGEGCKYDFNDDD